MVLLNIKWDPDKLLMTASCRPSCVNSIAGGETRMFSDALWSPSCKTSISVLISFCFVQLCISGGSATARVWQGGYFKRTQKGSLLLLRRLTCGDLSASSPHHPLWLSALLALPKIRPMCSLHSILNSANYTLLNSNVWGRVHPWDTRCLPSGTLSVFFLPVASILHISVD